MTITETKSVFPYQVRNFVSVNSPASSAMQYYICKGFFDTIPKSLDEAARIDLVINTITV